jgi:hypothetical protein
VQRNNQDSFGRDDSCGLYLICDGIEAAAGGEATRSLAAEPFLSFYFLPMELSKLQYERIKDALRTTGKRSSEQSASAEWDFVCGRAWLQVAWVAEAVRPLAHRVYAQRILKAAKIL